MGVHGLLQEVLCLGEVVHRGDFPGEGGRIRAGGMRREEFPDPVKLQGTHVFIDHKNYHPFGRDL